MGVKLAVPLVFLVFLGPSCSGSDNYALLANTLKTLQRVACDKETISLACPWGTFISIYSAKYSKTSSASRCTVNTDQGLVGVVNDNCLWPNNMQYSLLQTVVEACQKKPQCKFNIKPKPEQADPCPNTSKSVEVGYKCRPTEFRIQSVCRDYVIRLQCNPRSRIAIHEAKYGRTAYETTCPQPSGLKDESCTAPLATEKAMKLCHGKRRCEITASDSTFGSPCKPASMTILKLYYTCVPLGVLKKKYETAAEKDEVMNGIENNHDGNQFDDDTDAANDRIWDEMNAITPVADSALQPLPNENEEPIPTKGYKSDLQDAIKDENRSKGNLNILIYISISIAIAIICMIIVITIRCIYIRRSSNNSKTGDMFTTEPPNVFNDAVSDVDNDIDVSHISGTYYDHPDMILYREAPNRGIRAMRPLTTIYPASGVNMYGVDYVPPREEKFKSQSDVIMSPKSLGECSSSYYG